MRKRITYANVAATLALVFSMTGGALAAKHYLINSTSQINPKVLKKLKAPGATGKTGAQGLPGAAGKEGAPGKNGETGPAGSAKAFASVTSAGALTTGAPSSGVSAVTNPSEGVYCLTVTTPGVAPSNSLALASPDAAGTNGETATVRQSGSNCPGKFEVDTFIYKETGTGIISKFTDEPFTFAVV
jgi:hypothetical protein